MIFIVCNNFYETFSLTEENKPTSEGPQVALQDVSFNLCCKVGLLKNEINNKNDYKKKDYKMK